MLSRAFNIVMILGATTYSCIVVATVHVAVIDTGFDKVRGKEVPICGLYDHTGTGPQDVIGHGTTVAITLVDAVKKINPKAQICVEVHKVIHRDTFGIDRLVAKALKSLTPKVRVVNISLASPPEGSYSEEEHAALYATISKGVLVVVPAGNTRNRIMPGCTIYPVCYMDLPLIRVGDRGYAYSGYGPGVSHFAGAYYLGLSGTSLSAPKIAAEMAVKIWEESR